MIDRSTLWIVALATAVVVAPAAGQEPEVPADTTEEAAEAAEETADETAEAAEETAEAAAEAPPTHDWEFALAPTEHVPGASGLVKVTENDAANAFVVETTALPVVDSLDTEARDVNAFTVWIVPSKDEITESSLAGILTLDPETGTGLFEGSTDLDTFGVIVTATPDAAPERISGVPVLTGIPVRPEAEGAQDVDAEPDTEETPVAEEAPAPAPGEAGEAPPTEPEAPEPIEPPEEETVPDGR